LLEKAEAAGAAVTMPRDRPWGIYSGYFRDLDGHLWEIIWTRTEAELARTSGDIPARWPRRRGRLRSTISLLPGWG
jgi:hypothetical protein